MGVVLACAAPYIHILYPKKSKQIVVLEKKLEQNLISKEFYDLELSTIKEEQKLFGFRDARMFWYAFGLPLTMFFFAVLFMFFTSLVSDPSMNIVGRFSAIILFFIASYHIIWILWPRQDLPKSLYHLSIVLIAALATCISLLLIRYKYGLKHKIGKLIRFISVDAYFKYIKQEDRETYIQDSFSVYDDITKP